MKAEENTGLSMDAVSAHNENLDSMLNSLQRTSPPHPGPRATGTQQPSNLGPAAQEPRSVMFFRFR